MSADSDPETEKQMNPEDAEIARFEQLLQERRRELAEAIAQLRAIEKLRKLKRG